MLRVPHFPYGMLPLRCASGTRRDLKNPKKAGAGENREGACMEGFGPARSGRGRPLPQLRGGLWAGYEGGEGRVSWRNQI